MYFRSLWDRVSYTLVWLCLYLPSAEIAVHISMLTVLILELEPETSFHDRRPTELLPQS